MATIPPINPINLETFLGAPARIPGGLENGNVLPAYMNGPAFTPRSQQQASIEALNRALTGDLSASLTGGDRLLALAALMRSATRSGQRAGLTPQQVIGDLRQQQVQQAQARLQIEQLRAAEQRARERQQSVAQYVQTLPEEQRTNFLSLPENIQDEIIAQQYMPADEVTMSPLARQLEDAGYVRGTPEFRNLMRQSLSKGQTVGLAGGGVGYIEGLNFNLPMPATPEDADKLPSGTEFLLPDGTIGRVP